MSLVYYYCPMSSAERTTWALDELVVPCERVLVDFRKGETRTENFLRLNPNGKIPVLVVDDHPIYESLAILIYLGETYGVEAELYPAPGVERADCLKWMVWATASMLEAIQRYAASVEPAPGTQSNAREAAEKDVGRLLGILEAALAERDYLMGKQFSLADLAVAGFAPYFQFVNYDISRFDRVQRWVTRCLSRPAARSALGT